MINNINVISNVVTSKPSFISWFVILSLLAIFVIGIRYYLAKRQ